jgi:hypothetical protein
MCRALLIPSVVALAAFAGGCGLFAGAEKGPDAVFVVLPALPRDEVMLEVSFEGFTGEALEKRVVDWHTGADWDGLEKVIRAAGEERQGVMTSVWKGQVLRVAGQRRSHECFYLVVLLGSTTRVLGAGTAGAGAASPEIVHSLDHESLRLFLESVLDGMDRFEKAVHDRPTMTARGA